MKQPPGEGEVSAICGEIVAVVVGAVVVVVLEGDGGCRLLRVVGAGIARVSAGWVSVCGGGEGDDA